MTVTARFPLGVYSAQSANAFDRAEWPPSPVRLVGALLAAAHERPGNDVDADRSLIRLLCEAGAPKIVAPRAAALDRANGVSAVAQVQGSTRWGPVNEVKDGARHQARVWKVGTAIGDRPVHFVWPELTLTLDQRKGLESLASDVTFLGTTRSPVLLSVGESEPNDDSLAWLPRSQTASAEERQVATTEIRIPDEATIERFDTRHSGRHSAKARPQSAGFVPGFRIGREVPYVCNADLALSQGALDPRWWGDAIVLPIDGTISQTVPKVAASYLLARATRRALMGAYEAPGEGEDAPPILHGRGDAPHCAFVPLSDVWHRQSAGHIKGVAIVLPHEARVADLAEQRRRLERALLALFADGNERRYVAIPGAGRVYLRRPDAMTARQFTLRQETYGHPDCVWTTITPLVHARWRRGGPEATLEQVTEDCAHVGLPPPSQVELSRASRLPGAAARQVAAGRVPEAWRGPLNGPTGHLTITFARPIKGPVILGRARHFGLGLCAPEHVVERLR